MTVTVKSIPRVDGTLEVAVYDDSDRFPDSWLRSVRRTARAGTMQITFENLPTGDYAALAFLDLNADQQLNSDWFGIPREPWGGSFRPNVDAGSPRWEDVVFRLPDTGTSTTIEMIMR